MLSLLSFKGVCSRKDFTIAFFIRIIILFVFELIIHLDVVSASIREQLLIVEITFLILTIIPWVAIMIRRLHDINKSGIWILFAYLVPPFTTIIVYVLLFSKGRKDENKYLDLEYNIKNKNFYIILIPIVLIISIFIGFTFKINNIFNIADNQNNKNVVNNQQRKYCVGGITQFCNSGYFCAGGMIKTCIEGGPVTCAGGNLVTKQSCIHGSLFAHTYYKTCSHGYTISHTYYTSCVHGFTGAHSQPCIHGFTTAHYYKEKCKHGYENAHYYYE